LSSQRLVLHKLKAINKKIECFRTI